MRIAPKWNAILVAENTAAARPFVDKKSIAIDCRHIVIGTAKCGNTAFCLLWQVSVITP